MTSLDHTAYPNIIDTIINAAPLATLLALRGTCRTFRDRIDRHMFYHVELDNLEGGEVCLVTANTAFQPTPTRHLPFRASRVRVADQVSQTPAPVITHNPFTAFTKLHTLRRREYSVWADDAFCFTEVKTLVDFIDIKIYIPDHELSTKLMADCIRRNEIERLRCLSGSTAPVIPKLYSTGERPTGTIVQCPPPKMRRYVMHVRHDKAEESLPSRFGQIIYRRLGSHARARGIVIAEFVVVFHRSLAPPHDATRLSDQIENFINWIVSSDEMERDFRPVKTPFMRKTGFTLETAYTIETEFTLVGFNTTPGEHSPVRALRSTRCLTMEQWLDTLGDRREIEGTWGGPSVY
ncbi:uncharacterized protein LOC62_04G005261 [Vanrija pseudolonga]|uniref:F-box domain-containing protein n=1 Tax=Vanrija pseudolonga TaxID=143232 RepID=A0AAF0Y7Y2_9TREE|nr:hypothetical protein LOC62_04G005261 [Vanrija pseudolonga]